MRLRNIPQAKEYISHNPYVIFDPSIYRSQWRESLCSNMPLFLEIGCGKGQFVINNALASPNVFYIGMEMYESVLYRALQKLENVIIPNLRFINDNAKKLDEMFSKGEVDHIFLNFSDPWPKKRHSNRRLTSPVFLDIYSHILKPGGIIEFKTDNVSLFEYSKMTFHDNLNYEVLSITHDLYNNPELLEGNIPTEYEEKFVAQGNPICKIISKLK